HIRHLELHLLNLLYRFKEFQLTFRIFTTLDEVVCPQQLHLEAASGTEGATRSVNMLLSDFSTLFE
ncbi:hypothetical protein, partial [uncultured Paenibacillus sp.]|uniref:hypothetical protein n=1 Tax=uncultured Paenibacillus sp. TaxID=227322 RepID=UPI0025914A67